MPLRACSCSLSTLAQPHAAPLYSGKPGGHIKSAFCETCLTWLFKLLDRTPMRSTGMGEIIAMQCKDVVLQG